ncbi:autotransporter-associated beta strand repeat-containing protein [Luteolibacter arcticus]|uniref:Autotransporter-associated beta strand repeat-containing protein n=1 Tax=Luteolibacter arcticus TaxID=1581411 RepID=A0ABT3GNF8_9BACT|nr:autotransporter-associated beta strand repeat-containing protein [Luteolibacter arcticus]MCW1925048.1 autotransporter-associated beta strand repeat-containing protein [Luteolibacter arcticus]
MPTVSVSRATLLATSFGLAAVSHANDIIKLDNTTALNDGASWTGLAVPGSGDVAVWNNTVLAANTTLLGGDLSWSGIRVANPGGAVAINAGNTLTLGAAGIDMSTATQNLALTNAIALGAAQNWNIASGRTLTAAGALSGAGLVKSGAGTAVLGGSNASWANGFTVSQGKVQMGTGANSAFGTGNIALGDSNSATEPVSLSFQGITANTTVGNITVANFGGGTTILGTLNAANSNAAPTIPTLTLNKAVTLSVGETTATNRASDLIFGTITGTGAGAGEDSLILTGTSTAGTTTLRTSITNGGAASNFTGNVRISAARWQMQNRSYVANTLANQNLVVPDTSSVTMNAGTTWSITHGIETINGLGGSGTINAGGGAYLDVANNGHLTVGGGNGSGNFSGSVSGITLRKIGTGTQTLSGTVDNSSSSAIVEAGTLVFAKDSATMRAVGGSATVKGGTLQLAGTGGDQFFQDADLIVTAGTFDMNGRSETIDALSGAGGTVLNSAATTTSLLTVGSGNSTGTGSYSGVIANGDGILALTKSGAGTLTLNGANTHTGTLTVNAGTLALGATGSITAPLVVNSGGTFAPAAGSTYTSPAITVNTGGTLNGTATGGFLIRDNTTLTGEGAVTGGLTLGSTTGAGLAVNLATSGALAVTGSVTLNGTAALQPSSLAPGSSVVLTYTGSLLGTGAFSASSSGTRTAPVINTSVPGIVTINHVAGPGITWAGGDGMWDLSGSNWDNGGTSAFFNLDSVTFPQTAGTYDITIPGGTVVSPNAITFTHTSGTYTIGGAGTIAGATGLNLSGTGTVVLNTANTFLGKTIVDAGTLLINSESALGGNPVSLVADQLTLVNGGALGGTANLALDDANRGITLGTGGGRFLPAVDTTMTVNRPLAGNGGLTVAGAGTLALNYTSGTIATPLQIDSGTLNLKYDAGNVTYSGPITGSSGILRLEGTGASATTGLTLTGTNSFTGETHIYGRRIFLNTTGGNAIGGDVVFKQTSWPYHDLSLSQNEQIADTAVLRWDQPAGQDVYEFRLNGKTETVAGLISSVTSPSIIENAGYDGSNDNNIPAGKLIVNTPVGANHSYTGALRNENGGTGNGALSFEKAGPGTQTLVGNFSYTGTTTVSGGKLVLEDPSNATTTFVSSGATLATGATLELKRTGGTWSIAVPISGSGNLLKSGSGAATLSGTQSYTGTTTIEDGTLSFTGSFASQVIDVQSLGTLGTTTVGTGTTVKGNGLLVGVTFASGSTLTPGTASTIDTMFGDGAISFAAGSTCAMNVDRTGGSITSDQLINMDAITYGGTLTLTATGQAFQSGNVVSLFPGATSYGGGFTTVSLPSLGAGLSWDLSNLTVDGSIQVVSSTPTPVFNPPAGGYIGAQSVSISSASGATIYYTMNGSTPTTSSPSGPSPITGLAIPTNSSVTIKAFAKKTGLGDSPVASATYNTLDLPVWITDFDGSWQDAVNWQGGVIAQGTGAVANFSTLTTTGTNTVSLDGLRTVGKLIFGDQGNAHEWGVAAGTGGSLTLNNGANAPVVDVVNQAATISAGITSSNGLRKEGAGRLNLTADNSISGPLTVVAGTLNFGASGAFPNGPAITLGATGSVDPTVALGFGGGTTIGALTVPAGVTGATLALPQNVGTFGHTVAGATLGSPLTIAQSNASGINWSQLTWNTKLTGNGGGSGNDTLVLSNTGTTQNYFTMGTGVVNDFLGNVRVKGFIAAQSGSVGSNFMIPDASMLIIESGQWRWNQAGFVETIDGLAGAGAMTNPGNVTLTIDASNADNHGDRLFSGSLGTLGGVLTKNGTGSQSFSGTGVTYTNATTINAGTLALTDTTAFASSAVTVNGGKLLVNNATGTGTGTTATIAVKTGATLAGAGSVSGVTTIEAGGTIAPGDASAGTLAANTVTLAGSYPCQLDGAAGDRLSVTGALTIDPAASITVSTLGTPTESSYTILSYGSLVGPLPVITGIPSGYSVDTSTPGLVKLVSGNAFDGWINGFPGLTNPADKTQTADPDKDGLANVIEFVLNSSPVNGTSTNLPTLTSSGANVVFTYTRRDDAESFNPTVEFDTDLAGTWTTAVDPGNCTIVVAENGSNPDTVTVTIPKGGNPKLFTRLKVAP